jgi:hypothetical protein
MTKRCHIPKDLASASNGLMAQKHLGVNKVAHTIILSEVEMSCQLQP